MSRGILGANGIVGGGIGIAAGSALASQMLGSGRVTICFFGDGALNEGILHEVSNLAAIWRLPCVFLCENNLYGASTPFKTVFKIENIAQRAGAYGMPGIVVDGNDVLAVYQVAKEAVDRARSGNGPTLIECMTYRLCGHSRSDPRTYRTREEEDVWKLKDPLPNFRQYLLSNHYANEDQIKVIEQEVERSIQDAIEYAEASPVPRPEDVYTDVFKE
jgi:TPP-dependent pyruvate/acetoin dehydrogenase alpha subunit